MRRTKSGLTYGDQKRLETAWMTLGEFKRQIVEQIGGGSDGERTYREVCDAIANLRTERRVVSDTEKPEH